MMISEIPLHKKILLMSAFLLMMFMIIILLSVFTLRKVGHQNQLMREKIAESGQSGSVEKSLDSVMTMLEKSDVIIMQSVKFLMNITVATIILVTMLTFFIAKVTAKTVAVNMTKNSQSETEAVRQELLGMRQKLDHILRMIGQTKSDKNRR